VIWTDNLSNISTALHRQAHDIEVLGKLCDREQPSFFSSTQSSMLNTPSEGPACCICCISTLKKVLHCAVQEELNDTKKWLSSGTTQNSVVDLSKICCHYPMSHTSLIKQEGPFLLRLILNPLAEGLYSTSPSPSDIWSI
jgi:hypothetical protein